MSGEPLSVFLIAGEPSGDVLGGRLMAALREVTGGAVRFTGIGGPRMVEQGLESLFPLDDLAVFGLAELLPRLVSLIRRIDQTVAAILATRPDVVVTIDAPSFNARVVKRVRAAAGDARPRMVHYVAPTVWAWRPERAKKAAGLYDHLMVLLPFEPPYFEREGLSCSFVGHPVVESGAGSGDGGRFRARFGLGPDDPLLVVLPGSRVGEVRRLLGDFRETVALVAPGRKNLTVAVPTVPSVAERVRAGAAGWPVRTVVVESDQDKYDAFAAARAALAASGTVALELALARLPTVIAYRLHPLTVALYRRLITVKYVNLVNLMHDRMVVPELLQEHCRPAALAAALVAVLDDPAVRRDQIEAYDTVAGWLAGDLGVPSRRAAAAVLAAVRPKS